MSADEFVKVLGADIVKWDRVVKSANITVD